MSDELVKHIEEAGRELVRQAVAPDWASPAGCPAGDPCPGTGCPACCPSYDPCGESSCTFRCNNERLIVAKKKPITEQLTEEEAAARGLVPDPSVEPDEVCCDEVEQPMVETEVESPTLGKLARETPESRNPRFYDEKPCQYSCAVDGVRYRECPVHGRIEVKGTCRCGHPETPGIVHSMVRPCHMLGVNLGDIIQRNTQGELRFVNMDDNRTPAELAAAAIEEAAVVSESSGSAVFYPYTKDGKTWLAPNLYVKMDPNVVYWYGVRYFREEGEPEATKSEPTPEMIAELKAERERDMAEERRSYMRRDSMQWAVDMHKNNPDVSDEMILKTARIIFDWMTENHPAEPAES